MPDVAIAGLPLDYPHSGTASYLRHLLERLPGAGPDLAFRLYLRESHGYGFRIRSAHLQTPFRRLNHGSGVGARLDKLAWEIGSFPLATTRDDASLLHFPYFAAPLVSRAPVVVTIHDVIPLVLPDYHRGRSSLLYARFMTKAVRRAAAIITVSEYSRRDILCTVDVPPERVFVTPEAADPECTLVAEAGEREGLRAKYGLPARYFLYLGSAEKRKNLAMLVEAWATVRRGMTKLGIGLVIVARFPPPDTLYPDIPGFVHRHGLGESVHLVPSVSAADKPALYRQALGFCFPSTYEGFGLPPIEAMACGTPVLCSSATSLPEVVGDAACLLDPANTEGWGAAMVKLADDERLRDELRRRGLIRAAQFSWQRTAAETVNVYRHVLGQ
ncbi:MAG: glycosyltransferase family 4 protein [Chloroflexota bacterium]